MAANHPTISMSRRRFLTSVPIVVVGLCVAAEWASAAKPDALAPAQTDVEFLPFLASERPALNVLLIVVDELNDWIGCLGGHPQTITLNMDRLAKSGTLFTNAHCAAPLCNPSRTSLLTGQRPTTTGVYNNQQDFRAVLPNISTLTEHFRQSGYFVAGAGKVYHPYIKPPYFSELWDDFYPADSRQFIAGPSVPGSKIEGWEDHYCATWSRLPVADEAMGDGMAADWIADQLATEHDRPLFSGLGIYLPHCPWFAPQQHFERFDGEPMVLPDDSFDLTQVSKVGRAWAGSKTHEEIVRLDLWAGLVQAYLACVSFADALVGKVLDALDAGPHAQNTVVILIGDNGYHLGEKTHWSKETLWEESTRVPFIMRVPGIMAGQNCARPVSLLDVYPTLVDLCGLPQPAHPLEGTSLLPLLRDPNQAWEPAAVTSRYTGKCFGDAPWGHALRTERWRYITYSDGGEELYDHWMDPQEQHNLAYNPAFSPTCDELHSQLVATIGVVNPGCLRTYVPQLTR